MERTYWHESLEDVQQRIHSYQRHQEDEEEETKNWRDQLARKDSLLARLGELEAAAADCRKRQQLCTQQLRRLIPSTTQSSFSLSTPSFSVSGVSSMGKFSSSSSGGQGGGQESSSDSITQSLAVRSQLIETTRELNDIEIEQERCRQEVIKVQESLERSLLNTNRSPKTAVGGSASHSSYQHYPLQRDNIHSSGESIVSMKTTAGGSIGIGGNDEEMSEIITHGIPSFSPDLVSHLLSGLPLQPSSGNDETWPTTPPANASNGDNFYSVDEVVNDSSFITSFYRMQGESARYYLKRLRSRRENLIYLQFSVAKAFSQQLAKVKHGRHRQRERELRRLRLEMQKMQLEKVQAEALVAASRWPGGNSTSSSIASAQQQSLSSPPTLLVLRSHQSPKVSHHGTFEGVDGAMTTSELHADTDHLLHQSLKEEKSMREEGQDGNNTPKSFTSSLSSHPSSSSARRYASQARHSTAHSAVSPPASPSHMAGARIRELVEEKRRLLIQSLRALSHPNGSDGEAKESDGAGGMDLNSAELIEEEKEILALISLYLQLRPAQGNTSSPASRVTAPFSSAPPPPAPSPKKSATIPSATNLSSPRGKQSAAVMTPTASATASSAIGTVGISERGGTTARGIAKGLQAKMVAQLATQNADILGMNMMQQPQEKGSKPSVNSTSSLPTSSPPLATTGHRPLSSSPSPPAVGSRKPPSTSSHSPVASGQPPGSSPSPATTGRQSRPSSSPQRGTHGKGYSRSSRPVKESPPPVAKISPSQQHYSPCIICRQRPALSSRKTPTPPSNFCGSCSKEQPPVGRGRVATTAVATPPEELDLATLSPPRGTITTRKQLFSQNISTLASTLSTVAEEDSGGSVFQEIPEKSQEQKEVVLIGGISRGDGDPVSQSACKRREDQRYDLEALSAHLLAAAAASATTTEVLHTDSASKMMPSIPARSTAEISLLQRLVEEVQQQRIEMRYLLQSLARQQQSHTPAPATHSAQEETRDVRMGDGSIMRDASVSAISSPTVSLGPVQSNNTSSITATPPSSSPPQENIGDVNRETIANDAGFATWKAQMRVMVQSRAREAEAEIARICRSASSSKHGTLSSSKSPSSNTFSMEVEVVLARHLPARKTLTGSCDAYVEVVALHLPEGIPPPPVTVSKSDMGNAAATYAVSCLRGLCAVGQDIITGQPFLVSQSGSGNDEISLLAYGRTSVQRDSCFPEWREIITLRDIPFPSQRRPLAIWFLLRQPGTAHSMINRGRSRSSIGGEGDDIIAQTCLLVGEIAWEKVWSSCCLSLLSPTVIANGNAWMATSHEGGGGAGWRSRGKVRGLDPRCVLKVSMRHCPTGLQRWKWIAHEANQWLRHPLLLSFSSSGWREEEVEEEDVRQLRSFLRLSRNNFTSSPTLAANNGQTQNSYSQAYQSKTKASEVSYSSPPPAAIPVRRSTYGLRERDALARKEAFTLRAYSASPTRAINRTSPVVARSTANGTTPESLLHLQPRREKRSRLGRTPSPHYAVSSGVQEGEGRGEKINPVTPAPFPLPMPDSNAFSGERVPTEPQLETKEGNGSGSKGVNLSIFRASRHAMRPSNGSRGNTRSRSLESSLDRWKYP
eukprot:scaffold4415_cov170-Ochromonas_danica.AAC.2